jgi:hypothetical protein
VVGFCAALPLIFNCSIATAGRSGIADECRIAVVANCFASFFDASGSENGTNGNIGVTTVCSAANPALHHCPVTGSSGEVGCGIGGIGIGNIVPVVAGIGGVLPFDNSSRLAVKGQ